jgi:hypothetical protein
MKNPILEELYEIRRAILAEHGDDLTKYFREQFEKTKAAGHPIANIKQRKIKRPGTVPTIELPVDNVPSPTPEG